MFRPRFSKTMRTPAGGWLGFELSSICPMSDARPDSASQPTSTSTNIAPMRNRSCRADTTEVLVPSAADWTGATNEFLDPSAAVWTNESYKSSYLKLALTLTIARTSSARGVSSENIRLESPSFRRASQEPGGHQLHELATSESRCSFVAPSCAPGHECSRSQNGSFTGSEIPAYRVSGIRNARSDTG